MRQAYGFCLRVMQNVNQSEKEGLVTEEMAAPKPKVAPDIAQKDLKKAL